MANLPHSRHARSAARAEDQPGATNEASRSRDTTSHCQNPHILREQGAQACMRTLLVISETCSPVFMSRRSIGPNLSNRRSTSRGLASYSKLPAVRQDLSMSFKGMQSCGGRGLLNSWKPTKQLKVCRRQRPGSPQKTGRSGLYLSLMLIG